jgi:hypothetical protein
MPNRTEPKTVKQWITYLFMAAIAIWLIVWTRPGDARALVRFASAFAALAIVVLLWVENALKKKKQATCR